MSNISKFVAALVGLLLMAIVASRELFLFTVARNPQGSLDSQGGRYHLWLAVGAGITACVAGGLMFYFFLHHEKTRWSKVSMPPGGTRRTAVSDNLSNNAVTPAPFDAIGWTKLNPWLSEGRFDDTRPMNGSVADSSGTPSAKRAFARRSHQVMFKKWSQARHD
jgi:hypothetical protein